MNRVLLVGNGAREHAMAEALVKNNSVELYAFMSKLNPGINKLAKKSKLGDLKDSTAIINFAENQKINLAVIGPEDPLSRGIVDKLTLKNIPCASPNQEMSKIEWSKVFARTLMEEHKIDGCPSFHIFSKDDNQESIKKELQTILKDKNNMVAIKPDYLTGGKGVKVWGDHLNSLSEVLGYVKDVLKNGNGKVVVEEKLQQMKGLRNSEFTLQTFISGKQVIPMPLVQDFKRAYNGDKGPNTGSMGSYSCSDHSLPFLSKSLYQKAINIMKKTAQALENYKGILYGQFMLTNDSDVKLIEYNSRFGDPEALNVLPLLKSDFSSTCEEIVDGRLTQKTWENKATVCVYLTPRGYPTNPIENAKIQINPGFSISRIYYASVHKGEENEINTTRSRSIGLLGFGDSVKEARSQAYQSLKNVSGNLHYRTDIAEGI